MILVLPILQLRRSNLALFLRYGDLLAENCVFFLYLLSFGAPGPRSLSSLEFRGEVNREETRVMGLLVVNVA